jgi:hypothetical protein
MSTVAELQQRVVQLEAVIREQERTIQQESSARALAVARLKVLQRRQRAQKGSHARS